MKHHHDGITVGSITLPYSINRRGWIAPSGDVIKNPLKAQRPLWSGIMSKSLNARCIRRWEVEFKPFCDSKVNPYWRKRDLRGYIREAALTTAYSMVESMAERNAKVDYDGEPNGWTPEFSAWYRERHEQYLKEARDYLDEDATNDEIDDEIENELEAWND